MNILSAGAAKGLLHTIAAREAIELTGEFGAVGAMRERLKAGAPCDVIVLTAAMISELAASGEAHAASVVALGSVDTGVARLNGAPTTELNSVVSLRRLLTEATRLYFPDPAKATAGMHVIKVLTALGLAASHRERFATFANGATAMRAMADAGDDGSVGITQRSEILYTEGVQYVGALPRPHALATVYCAAMMQDARDAAAATRLLTALADARYVSVRRDAGFAVG